MGGAKGDPTPILAAQTTTTTTTFTTTTEIPNLNLTTTPTISTAIAAPTVGCVIPRTTNIRIVTKTHLAGMAMDEVGVTSTTTQTTTITNQALGDMTEVEVTVITLRPHHLVGTADHHSNLLRPPSRFGFAVHMHAMTAVLGVGIPTHEVTGRGISIADKEIENFRRPSHRYPSGDHSARHHGGYHPLVILLPATHMRTQFCTTI